MAFFPKCPVLMIIIVMTLLLITGKELDENGVGDGDDSRSADWF